MSPTPAEERPPTDHDWSTAELPATPQRYFLIPAERWIEAPPELRALGADFGIDARRVQAAHRPLPVVAGRARGGRRRALHGDRGRRPERALDVPAVPRRLGRGRRAGRIAHALSHAGRRTCVTPPQPESVANPFAAPGVGVALRPRPAVPPSALARAHPRDRRRRADRSRARPRVRHRHVDGRARRASRDVRGRGRRVARDAARRRAARRTARTCSRTPKRLPFPDASFDAATCCSGVHWFDQRRFFAELRARAAARAAGSALYDHYFMGEMIDVPEFADVAARRARALPAAAAQPAGRRSPQRRARRASSRRRRVLRRRHRAHARRSSPTTSSRSAHFVAAAERGTPATELRGVAARVDRAAVRGRRDPHGPVPRLDHLLSPRRAERGRYA